MEEKIREILNDWNNFKKQIVLDTGIEALTLDPEKAIPKLTALFNAQNQKLKPKQPIVITDIIDIITDFIKQEKVKAAASEKSKALTELFKKLEFNCRLCRCSFQRENVINDKSLKQFFTEAGMK